MPARVLLAAGDPAPWEELSNILRALGLSVRCVESGRAALRLDEQVSPVLTLVATDLPDIHALDMCRRLRGQSDRPLIVLSDATDELDRVLALELGADDVIGERCRTEELRERVKAALRRSNSLLLDQSQREVMDFGRIVIDRSTRCLIVDDRCCELTQMECDLFWALAEHAGQVVESGYLLETVWGYPRGIKTRTLDVHIGRLRRKLGEDGKSPRHIITVRSVGFRFDPGEVLRADDEAAA